MLTHGFSVMRVLYRVSCVPKLPFTDVPVTCNKLSGLPSWTQMDCLFGWLLMGYLG